MYKNGNRLTVASARVSGGSVDRRGRATAEIAGEISAGDSRRGHEDGDRARDLMENRSISPASRPQKQIHKRAPRKRCFGIIRRRAPMPWGGGAEIV